VEANTRSLNASRREDDLRWSGVVSMTVRGCGKLIFRKTSVLIEDYSVNFYHTILPEPCSGLLPREFEFSVVWVGVAFMCPWGCIFSDLARKLSRGCLNDRFLDSP